MTKEMLNKMVIPKSNTKCETSGKIDMETLSSVWSINTVNPFLDRDVKNPAYNPNRHPTIFPEELAYRIIELYSRRGDVVLDPFCGTGTTSAVALKNGRKPIGYELSPEYIKTANERCKNRAAHFCKSSEDMVELRDGSVDLCLPSPPYLGFKKFTDYPDDISTTKRPYQKLNRVLREIFRVLKPGGALCLNVCDFPKERGILSTFPYDMIYMSINAGFRMINSVVWKKTIRLTRWNLTHKKIRHNHEYIWVFKKPWEVA